MRTSKHRWQTIPFVMLMLGLAFNLADAQDRSQVFGYEEYATLLQTYVDEAGMVDYRGLKTEGTQLNTFARRLAELPPMTYERWDDAQQIAFWINAYNAFTLKAIIDHYPIRASRLRSLRFPKNSIRQISGVWTKLQFTVMGQERTLDEIEHKILRSQFNEPRIHMALVCAAMGCPPLRSEPYMGAQLDTQLDDQSRRFLQNPLKFRLDRDEGKVYLSSIFDWFGDDFVSTYGTDEAFEGYNQTERAVLNFVSRYLDQETQAALVARKHSVKHLDYDWSLNEQPSGT